jgi:hypothetical protein
VIEANIYDVLAAGLGSAAPGGIFPVVLPEANALPALTYQLVGGRVDPTFSTSGMKRARLQLDCWGATYLAAITLRSAAIQAFDGYLDANINVQLLQSLDHFDDDARIYRAIVEFYVFYGS